MRFSRSTHSFIIACVVLSIYYLLSRSPLVSGLPRSLSRLRGPSVTTVVATDLNEDTTWLWSLFPFWKHQIYITEKPGMNASLPSDKGLESMAYLTYIIDNYNALPDIAVFMHGARYRWHNDDPLYDSARVLSRLQLPHVQEQGYVNMRCVWTIGCPAEIHPEQKSKEDVVAKGGPIDGIVYASAFRELFPDVPLPSRVGASCCAHFAASRSAILSRPREDYVKYRQWLVRTDIDGVTAAKVLEYSWHMIFGQAASYCPSAKQCYCRVFGLCNVPCEGPGTSKTMYNLPNYATFPKGWPWMGWDSKWQNATSVGHIPDEDLLNALPTKFW